MENLISGLLNTALDAASSALHLNNKSPPSSPTAGGATSIDRSTWAEIAAGKGSHNINHEELDGWHKTEQQQHSGSWQSDYQRNSSWQPHSQSYSSTVTEYTQQGDNCKDGEESGWKTMGHHHNRPQVNSHHKVPDEQVHQFRKPPHEQYYAKPIESDVDIEPTEEELCNLAAACGRLWELDLSRLTPGLDYEINCGNGKKVYEKEDMAENSLFRKVNKDVFLRPTYARFYALLDNYSAKQGVQEHVTEEKRHEEAAFIEEICRTAPIKYLHKYLAAKRLVSRSHEEFKQHLHSLWFGLYGRGGTHGSSSAFEHVFVGEIKIGHGEEEVSGFHNWIKFYVEEAAGRVDYQGYILPRRRNAAEPDAHSQCISIQFTWNGVLKPVSSTFIGVSPEFELALYTICFYEGPEDNFVELGPYSVNIKCYHLGRDKMGSCFPIAEE